MAKKPSWLFRQSAAIPFLEEQGRLRIVLVSSKSKTGWIFPKGVVERFYTPEKSAEKETFEEAGVVGEISDNLLHEYEYEKWGGICTVKVYPLKVTEVLDEWQEMAKRDRLIVMIDEAIGLVKPAQRSSLEVFKERYAAHD